MLIHLPDFEMARRHACDPCDPNVIWETPGGCHWPCTVPWDRQRYSSCPQQADNESVALLRVLMNELQYFFVQNKAELGGGGDHQNKNMIVLLHLPTHCEPS